MAQKTLAEALDDPKFAALNPDVQRAVLTKLGVSEQYHDRLLAKVASKKGPGPAATAYDKYLASGAPTSTRREPGKMAPMSFLSRTSERIGKDIHAAFDLPGMQKGLEEGAKNRPPGGYLGSAEGRKTMLGSLKEMAGAYKDPANIAGDVTAGVLLGQMGDSAPVRERERVPAPTPVRERPTPGPIPEPPLTEAQQAKYTDALDRANREHAQALIDYADKEARRRSQWVQKAYGANKSEAEAIGLSNKKATLTRGADEYLSRATQNIQETHQTVRGRLDARWNTLRGVMADASIQNPGDIYNAITSAESQYLRGAPESLQQFRNLIKELGIKDFAEGEDGSLSAIQGEGPKPMDWQTARVHYSAIGDRLSAGNLPGNVYQALKSVANALDAKLAESAATRDMGQFYTDLKRDWSQYMTDWRDLSSVSSGGSPLAKLLRSPDKGFARLQVMGKAGDRLLETLARYKRAGARPELLVQARRLNTEAGNIPKAKIREFPGKYEPGPQPELREVQRPRNEPGTSTEVPGKGSRIAARTAGKVVGAAAGAAIGHPFLGYASGGEVGEAVLNRLWRAKKNRPVTNVDRPPI